MTQTNGSSKFSKSLLPPEFLNDLIKNEKHLDNYRSALSTFTAIMAMIVTNFAIDAPLTALLTNKMQGEILKKEANIASMKKEDIYA